LAATNRLAALELAANRTEAASALITQILTINPRDNDALIERANIALARGQATKAIADLRAVLRDQPDAPAILRTLAQAYAANKDEALAEETLRASMRANPDDVQTRLALSQLLIKAGRASEAQSVVDQLVTDQPGEIAAVEAAMRVQVGRRDLVGARRSAENIKRLRPDLPLGYYLAGLVDEAEGKTVAAREGFEHALSIAPESFEPLAAAARVDLALGQSDRALARINAVIVRAPKNAVVRALKGEVLTQLKRPDDAVAVLNESITLAPTWWVSYRDLALAEISAGSSERAVVAYQRGLQATEASPNLLTELAALYEKLGRPEEAIAQYEAWLQRDALSEVASNNLAMLLVTHKAKDPASLQRAFVLAQRLKDSNEPIYLDTYAWVQYVRGEYSDAVTMLQRVVELAPGVAVFRAHLGLAQYRAGKPVEANRNLEEALGGAADFAEAAEARAALAALRRG
jgi:tetratricopeptide (TPR) repeat protein